jgi:hypothetical protein
MKKEMTAFFDAYAKSFEQEPAAIAAFYSEPCVTARGGVVRVNSSQRDTIAFFTEVIKQYRSRGFTHGNYLSLDWQHLGANSILATLRWAYKDTAGKTIWETTFSYNLYQREGAWKILLQTMHDQ